MNMQDEALDELVTRLVRGGGKTYSKISNGASKGYLGVNGTAYFALYDDGAFARFDRPITAADLKEGWVADQLTATVTESSVVKKTKVSAANSDTVVEEAPVKKGRKKKDKNERVWQSNEQIYLSDTELKAVCKIEGQIETAIIDRHFTKKVETDNNAVVEVAHVEVTINVRNKNFNGWMGEDVDRAGNKRVETLRYQIWRSWFNPVVLYSKVVTDADKVEVPKRVFRRAA